jgi:hypothetical protein
MPTTLQALLDGPGIQPMRLGQLRQGCAGRGLQIGAEQVLDAVGFRLALLRPPSPDLTGESSEVGQ